jgi:hypothetical protein
LEIGWHNHGSAALLAVPLSPAAAAHLVRVRVTCTAFTEGRFGEVGEAQTGFDKVLDFTMKEVQASKTCRDGKEAGKEIVVLVGSMVVRLNSLVPAWIWTVRQMQGMEGGGRRSVSHVSCFTMRRFERGLARVECKWIVLSSGRLACFAGVVFVIRKRRSAPACVTFPRPLPCRPNHFPLTTLLTHGAFTPTLTQPPFTATLFST